MSDELTACHDCAANPGEPHQNGCDTARCLHTGGQRLCCHGRHDCGHDIWTGQWPGADDCIRFGWYSKFTFAGWTRCNPDDRGAGPDLNRLHSGEARWDRGTARWELEPWAVSSATTTEENR